MAQITNDDVAELRQEIRELQRINIAWRDSSHEEQRVIARYCRECARRIEDRISTSNAKRGSFRGSAAGG